MEGVLGNQGGFSLLEIIVAIMVAAIVGTMVYSYSYSAFVESSFSVVRFQQALSLQSHMEDLKADYSYYENQARPWQASHSYSESDLVIPLDPNNSHRYICRSGGTSGPAEPEWETALNNEAGVKETVDGGVKWTELLTFLYGRITAEQYGDYVGDADDPADETGFIRFKEDGTEELADAGDRADILKVTLENGSGEQLTILLTPGG